MNKIKILKKCAFIFCILIALMVVVSIMVKYEVEGEKTLPYSLSEIFVISTVEGTPTDDGENIWNVSLKQVNDLYFYINKDDVTEETIKEITIENFNVTKAPQKGNLAIYRPTGDFGDLYTHSEQDYLGSSLTYTGKIDDLKTLEIANNGGVFGCRMSLNDLGNYISNDSTEITYDGTLLKNVDVSIEDIKFSISFDILITTNKNVTYKGTLNIDLPGENVIEEGTTNFKINNFENVIFKRL